MNKFSPIISAAAAMLLANIFLFCLVGPFDLPIGWDVSDYIVGSYRVHSAKLWQDIIATADLVQQHELARTPYRQVVVEVHRAYFSLAHKLGLSGVLILRLYQVISSLISITGVALTITALLLARRIEYLLLDKTLNDTRDGLIFSAMTVLLFSIPLVIPLYWQLLSENTSLVFIGAGMCLTFFLIESQIRNGTARYVLLIAPVASLALFLGVRTNVNSAITAAYLFGALTLIAPASIRIKRVQAGFAVIAITGALWTAIDWFLYGPTMLPNYYLRYFLKSAAAGHARQYPIFSDAMAFLFVNVVPLAFLVGTFAIARRRLRLIFVLASTPASLMIVVWITGSVYIEDRHFFPALFGLLTLAMAVLLKSQSEGKRGISTFMASVAVVAFTLRTALLVWGTPYTMAEAAGSLPKYKSLDDILRTFAFRDLNVNQIYPLFSECEKILSIAEGVGAKRIAIVKGWETYGCRTVFNLAGKQTIVVAEGEVPAGEADLLVAPAAYVQPERTPPLAMFSTLVVLPIR